MFELQNDRKSFCLLLLTYLALHDYKQEEDKHWHVIELFLFRIRLAMFTRLECCISLIGFNFKFTLHSIFM